MSKQGDWICAACQHSNFKKRDACQRCTCPKFASPAEIASYVNRTEVLPGDWYCTVMNCGAHNYASRTACYRCGVGKTDCFAYGGGLIQSAGGCLYDSTSLPGWKIGDWACSRYGCGEHNYASRTECYKCKTPKDLGGI